MPRRARIAIAGIPWHIIQRGDNRSVCFYANQDYCRDLDTLREQADKFGCAIHAYVLMTNHVHLLLTPSKPDSTPLLMSEVKGGSKRGQARIIWVR
jgi:putative transposase